MTQTELAKRSGIGRNEISDIERGKRKLHISKVLRILSAVKDREYRIDYSRIEKIRKERGVTLDELAKRTALTVQLLRKIESGKSDIYITTLVNIAQALDISIKEFIVVE